MVVVGAKAWEAEAKCLLRHVYGRAMALAEHRALTVQDVTAAQHHGEPLAAKLRVQKAWSQCLQAAKRVSEPYTAAPGRSFKPPNPDPRTWVLALPRSRSRGPAPASVQWQCVFLHEVS